MNLMGYCISINTQIFTKQINAEHFCCSLIPSENILFFCSFISNLPTWISFILIQKLFQKVQAFFIQQLKRVQKLYVDENLKLQPYIIHFEREEGINSWCSESYLRNLSSNPELICMS